MRVPRFFTPQALALHRTISLEAAPSHHLIRVLRVPAEATVILFNGDGCDYRAVFTGTEGKSALLDITAVERPLRESPLQVHLGQGISRGERMDLVVQKSVELGVQTITPLWTQRSQVQLSGKRLDKRLAHWTGVATAACEQSGRVELADIRPAIRLTDWLGQADGEAMRIVLDPDAAVSLGELEAAAQISVLIGPEGGLTHAEIDAAVKAGFQPVRLGPRVLRTETAALAILAAMQTLWGDFRA